MFQVRIHGRGGQGVVTAAEILSLAAFAEGKHAQAFPSFGSERMGAPVMAFCRIDTQPIQLREPVMQPDAVIIQDPTLLHQVDLFAGLNPKGFILINTAHTLEELRIAELTHRFYAERICTVPATILAREHLGRPLPNAALLGGFAALTEQIRLESLDSAIAHKFPAKVADANSRAAAAAYQAVLAHRAPAATAAGPAAS